MTDYNQTRDAAGMITSRFSTMLKNLQEDYEDEIVVVSLMKYYEMDDGDGWTENPVIVDGNSIEDVKKMLLLILKDIDKHGVKDWG